MWVVGFVDFDHHAINLSASIWYNFNTLFVLAQASFWYLSTWWYAACTTARDGYGVEPAAVPQRECAGL